MIKFLKWVLIIGTVIILGAGVAGWRYFERYLDSPSPSADAQIIEIPRGSGMSAITNILRDAGIVTEPALFRLHARLNGIDTQLKAGEYRIPAAIAPRDLLDIMARGDALLHSVTVPEGLTTVEVMAIVAAADILTGDLPEPPPEGSLLPETYLVQRGETRTDLIARMQRDMQLALDEAWQNRLPDLPYESKEQALVLASIIEKETAVADEYRLVSGVFVNRLRQRMLLQTDPTVIFSLTEGKEPLGRALRFKDLEVDHPYNTYRYPGLPPGPIANPGRGAIQAAVNPASTEFLYFVADGTGGHAFGKTLAEHNRNVAKWRKIQRSNKN